MKFIPQMRTIPQPPRREGQEGIDSRGCPGVGRSWPVRGSAVGQESGGKRDRLEQGAGLLRGFPFVGFRGRWLRFLHLLRGSMFPQVLIQTAPATGCLLAAATKKCIPQLPAARDAVTEQSHECLPRSPFAHASNRGVMTNAGQQPDNHSRLLPSVGPATTRVAAHFSHSIILQCKKDARMAEEGEKAPLAPCPPPDGSCAAEVAPPPTLADRT
jgi:hypothetical protein